MSVLKTKIAAIALAASVFTQGSVSAQESELIWSFSQDNAAKTAGLTYGVPETDNIVAYAQCGGAVPTGTSNFSLATDYGTLQNATPTRIRFSGNGQEYEVSGAVEVSQSGEGLSGVKLSISNDDPIWNAFDSNSSLSYQIPGFAASQLPLVGGQDAIRNFVSACRFLASGGQQSTGTGGNNGNSNSGTGITEQQAFNLAKDLNSPEAWQAFLRVYPTGFFAELAKGYLARSDSGNANNNNNQTNTQAPTPAALPYVNPGLDSTPWYNFNYQQDEGNASSYAAGVRSRGVEFFAWCGPNRMVNFGLRESNRGIYPAFDQRARQAAGSGVAAKFQMADGSQRTMPFSHYELNGELGINQQVSPNDPIMTRLMKDNSFILDLPPMGNTFQLKNSRKSICNVLNRCGAVVAGCQRPVVNNSPNTACSSRSVYIAGRGCVLKKYANKPTRTKSPRVKCRSRSVYIEGRGCILKKYANKKSGSGCTGGRIRFEGRCLFRSQLRSYCGPGFTPKGRRCVSNAQVRPRYQQGVYVTQLYCERQGLTKEGNYCVEDD